jgi:hypothetical protein
MPENPNPRDKMKYIQLVMLPRWFPFKDYAGGEITATMNIDIEKHFDIFTNPDEFDNFENTRLRELERLQKKDWAECSNCKKLKEPEHFVPCYKTCLLCLGMTAEEAIEKFKNKKLAKENGQKCSTCSTNKLFNEFQMKPDGSYMKTCIKCVEKKRKKVPETTPEPLHLPESLSETILPSPNS